MPKTKEERINALKRQIAKEGLTEEEFLKKWKTGQLGLSVTQRIKNIKQPYGGYIKPQSMDAVSLGDGMKELNEENISPGLVGTAVDYLTRYMTGTSVNDSFSISLLGARQLDNFNNSDTAVKNIMKLMKSVKGLDDKSIINAVRMTGYDVCYRSSIAAYRPVEDICPDKCTIENIRKMVKRSLTFFEQYGPKTLDGLTFAGGYTLTVMYGDGDFLTNDTLWDFKVSRQKIKKEQTLQLLMYWRMGLHSIHKEYEVVKYLGIYNPRKNEVYRIAVDEIPVDVIMEVESDVIGYHYL